MENITMNNTNVTKIRFCRPKNKTEMIKSKKSASLLEISKGFGVDLDTFRNEDGYDELKSYENHENSEEAPVILLQVDTKRTKSFLKSFK